MRDTAELTVSGLEANPHYDPRVGRAAFGRGDPAAVAALLRDGMLRRPDPDEEVDPARSVTVRFSDGLVTAAGRPVGTLNELMGEERGRAATGLTVETRRTVELCAALRSATGMGLTTAAALAKRDVFTLELDEGDRARLRVALVERCGAENRAVARGLRHDVRLRAVDGIAGLTPAGPEPGRGAGPAAAPPPVDRTRDALVARMVAAADDGRGLGRTRDGERVALWVGRPDLEGVIALGRGRRANGAVDWELHRLGAAVTTPVYDKAVDTGAVASGVEAARHLLAGFGANAQRRVWVDREALDAAPTEALERLAVNAEGRRAERDRARMIAEVRASRPEVARGGREAG